MTVLAESETYWSLLHNLPHLEWELTVALIQDVLIGLFLAPKIKRFLKREHIRQDLEHGVQHREES